MGSNGSETLVDVTAARAGRRCGPPNRPPQLPRFHVPRTHLIDGLDAAGDVPVGRDRPRRLRDVRSACLLGPGPVPRGRLGVVRRVAPAAVLDGAGAGPAPNPTRPVNRGRRPAPGPRTIKAAPSLRLSRSRAAKPARALNCRRYRAVRSACTSLHPRGGLPKLIAGIPVLIAAQPSTCVPLQRTCVAQERRSVRADAEVPFLRWFRGRRSACGREHHGARRSCSTRTPSTRSLVSTPSRSIVEV